MLLMQINNYTEKIKELYLKCAYHSMTAYEKQIRQVNSARDLDVLMPMYNLTEYSGYYSKTSRSVRQYYRDEPNNILTNS